MCYENIMDKEIFRKKLIDEGFKHVYEWTDKPGTDYPKHNHKDKVSFYITAGSLTFSFGDKNIELKTGDRFDVPPGKEHSAKVGPQGCSFVVGEMIEDDS